MTATPSSRLSVSRLVAVLATLAIALAALVGSPLPASAAGTGSISGTIRGGTATQVPLAHVRVTITTSFGTIEVTNTFTDAAGRFTVTGLEAGPYGVITDVSSTSTPGSWVDGQWFTQPRDYVDPPATILVKEGEVAVLDLTLFASGQISGKLVVPGKTDLTGATVTLFADGIPKSFPINSDGAFHLDRLRPARYWLYFFFPDGYTSGPWRDSNGAGTFDLTEGQQISLPDFQLKLRGMLGGTVFGKSPSGDVPLAGAQVWAFDGATLVRSTVSQPDGSYSFPGLAAGRYTIRVEAADIGYWGAWYGTDSTPAIVTVLGSRETWGIDISLEPVRIVPLKPAIVGTAIVGSTLTVETGTWTPADVSLSYQWFADGDPIPEATRGTFILANDMEGAVISVTVTGSKKGLESKSSRSVPTSPVIPGIVKSKPVITGTPIVGQKLTIKMDDWGPGKVTLTYQWFADGVAIPNETGATYTPTKAVKGQVITVSVTGTKAGYPTKKVTSASTAPVGPK